MKNTITITIKKRTLIITVAIMVTIMAIVGKGVALSNERHTSITEISLYGDTYRYTEVTKDGFGKVVKTVSGPISGYEQLKIME